MCSEFFILKYVIEHFKISIIIIIIKKRRYSLTFCWDMKAQNS